MKPNLIRVILAAAAVFPFVPQLSAADTNAPVEKSSRDAATKTPVEIRSAFAGNLLGQAVSDGDGREVAKIEDLVIDLENGRVVNVVLSGTAAGEGRAEVPARTFSYDKKSRRLGWSGDVKRLECAPRFSPPGLNRPPQTAHVAEVYGYYDEEPYFVVENQPARKIPGNVHTQGVASTQFAPVPLGRLVLASDLIGARVDNAEGKKIGAVKDLVIDLPAGRVVDVIVSGGGVLGVGANTHAVPPRALGFAAEDNRDLRLIASAETLAKAPRYDEARLDDAAYTDDLYRAYQQEPYTASVAADNTRTNRRDRDGSTLTPLDQGNSAGEVDVTARIRKAILARDNLSVNAQNVKIITKDGFVTLRGPVKTAAEKDLIGDLAAREAGAFLRVDNQLEVSRD